MSEPMSVLDRYQEYRTRTYLKSRARSDGWMPTLRTQQRRRQVVVVLTGVFAVMVAGGVIAVIEPDIGILVFAAGCFLFLPVWTTLRIVADQRGDTPIDVLDELELAERNNARSLALTITQYLTAVPAFYLYFGSVVLDSPGPALATSGAVLVVACLFIGGCSSTMILGWTRPDPDPEDTV